MSIANEVDNFDDLTVAKIIWLSKRILRALLYTVLAALLAQAGTVFNFTWSTAVSIFLLAIFHRSIWVSEAILLCIAIGAIVRPEIIAAIIGA